MIIALSPVALVTTLVRFRVLKCTSTDGCVDLSCAAGKRPFPISSHS